MAIANGDLGFLDVIAEEVPNLDIFGTNVYRGKNGRDLYQRVQDTLDVPVVYTEFGADAFDAAAGQEDSLTQAYYVEAQWLDIYNHTYAGPGVGNAIGGYVFQWSDGWWKYKQTENLDIQDANASWPNAGYAEDFVEGRNNMNESGSASVPRPLPMHKATSSSSAARPTTPCKPCGPWTPTRPVLSRFKRTSSPSTRHGTHRTMQRPARRRACKR